jgi:ABC-type sugar transport system ATPase subunit
MIEFQNVSLSAGKFSLPGISFRMDAGDYAVLMGRTGSGKTTILEALCGLRNVVSGRIYIGGEDITDWKPALRGIGYVPQDGALFPSQSVAENLGFALHVRRVPRPQIRERVQELATMLGIEPLLQRRIHGLSGGERQRVALGRALAFEPRVLCLDEPLSALDEDTRSDMVELLRGISKRTGVTCLHVTHSRLEAKALATRIFNIHDGRVLLVNHSA